MALDPMSMSDAVDLLLETENYEGQKYIDEFLAGPDHDIFARNPELVAEIRDAVRDHAVAVADQAKPDYQRAYRQRQYGHRATR